FGREQRRVLLRQRALRFGKNPPEIVGGQRRKLDADREAALQLRHEIGRLREREGAGRDEKNVIGLDDAVLRRHRRAFDERQQVALHAFARHARAAPLAALRDLVDLVDEDDAVLLAVGQRLRLDFLVVDELAGFFLDQQRPRLCDGELALLTALPRERLE